MSEQSEKKMAKIKEYLQISGMGGRYWGAFGSFFDHHFRDYIVNMRNTGYKQQLVTKLRDTKDKIEERAFRLFDKALCQELDRKFSFEELEAQCMFYRSAAFKKFKEFHELGMQNTVFEFPALLRDQLRTEVDKAFSDQET